MMTGESVSSNILYPEPSNQPSIGVVNKKLKTAGIRKDLTTVDLQQCSVNLPRRKYFDDQLSIVPENNFNLEEVEHELQKGGKNLIRKVTVPKYQTSTNHNETFCRCKSAESISRRRTAKNVIEEENAVTELQRDQTFWEEIKPTRDTPQITKSKNINYQDIFTPYGTKKQPMKIFSKRRRATAPCVTTLSTPEIYVQTDEDIQYRLIPMEKTFLSSLPCSPGPKRRSSLRPSSAFAVNNQTKILDRRQSSPSNIYNNRPTKLTYEEWLTLKDREQRRQSIDALRVFKLEQIDEQYKSLERLSHGKTYDEWKEEKEKYYREKQKEEKRKENQLKKSKSEDDKQHEKLTERKYNEWLKKKYEEEVSAELALMQKLRLNSKEDSFVSKRGRNKFQRAQSIL
ncbi:microtubule-associated protein 9-like [Hydractinia symbiolongicarpus]|uniref:microtubule-associated protein 9-like n=1 Tax=Hydractinia symbiolongicarpus TaxID=13093 RepID=UPI00254AE12A|nr:microtubule-associated protein 9-like [Hydractinia symbiolongicarpus]